MALLASPKSVSPDVVWMNSSAGLWTASSSSRFVGQVQLRSGSFAVTDDTGRSVGRFATLPTAMNALRRADHLTVPGILRRDSLAAATAALGLVALAVAALATEVYFR